MAKPQSIEFHDYEGIPNINGIKITFYKLANELVLHAWTDGQETESHSINFVEFCDKLGITKEMLP